MPRIAQNKAGQYVSNLEPFEGHGSLKAVRDYEGAYVVYSYNTPILLVDDEVKRAYVNRAKYSVTTSKQQTYTFSGVPILAARGYEIINTDGARELESPSGYGVAPYSR